MYDDTSNRGRKYFCSYCLQAFRTEEILKRYIKDFFKFNGKQKIIIPKKGEFNLLMLTSKIIREKKSHHL